MLKRLLNRLRRRRRRGTPQSREQTPGHAIHLKNSEEKDLLKNDFESQKLAELWRSCGKQDYEKVMYGIYREHRGHRVA